MRVDSAPGEGSTFRCTVQVEELTQSADPAEQDEPVDEPTLSLTGRRALVAEDNAVNRTLALRLLARLGCQAEAVVDGQEALEALAREDYDFVLMDCQMPRLDGYRATQAIRDPATSVRNHNIPVVAMTANAMKGDREACLQAGMDDYVAKPVNPEALAATIRRVLQGAPVT